MLDFGGGCSGIVGGSYGCGGGGMVIVMEAVFVVVAEIVYYYDYNQNFLMLLN